MDNILENTTPIVVKQGCYRMEHHPACERTQYILGPWNPGYHHNLSYRTTEKVLEKKLGLWNLRDTFFFVSTLNMSPVVDIYARFASNQTLDLQVSGMFSLLWANMHCFILGTPTKNQENASCTLWQSEQETRQECLQAFHANCCDYGQFYYTYNKTMCEMPSEC
uniref:Lipocalin n=1 Tax=Rhipicephalus appendiculatus TaxID=34631 RepID=A0A131YE81_RHIAP